MPPTVLLEALQPHTLYGPGHERPHLPGTTYTVEERYADALIAAGMAKRVEAPDPPAKPKAKK